MGISRPLVMAACAITAGVAIACAPSAMPTAPSVPTPVPVVPAPVPTPTPTPTPAPPTTARYRVEFSATWSRSSHPDDFPSDAHLSPMVGGTHQAASRFWGEGTPATEGIRTMAETGGTSPLEREVAAAIAAGTAERVLLGSGIRAQESTAFEFEMSQMHPLVTLVAMIAPSPDWFLGVAGLPLFENGQWHDRRRVELVPWDAGTDSGSTFTSPDQATTPPQPVSRIVSAPLSPGGRVTPLGTFTFTRLQ